MKESFVFHFEYIEDIPEELQPEYAMYVINYARYGTEPEFNDWRDQRMWNKTKARMDEDAERYNRKCANLRRAKKTVPDMEESLAEDQETKEEDPLYTNGETEEKPKRKKFVKPSAEEVQAYCDERKNGINGQHFCDYYESTGWCIGSKRMKDWKAAVRNWETRHKNNTAYSQRQPASLPEDRKFL